MEKKEKGKKKVKIYFVGLLSSFWALFFGRFLTADVHHWTDELHLLDGTSPLLRDFPQYTVVHEKLPEGRDVHACDVHACTTRGMHSRSLWGPARGRGAKMPLSLLSIQERGAYRRFRCFLGPRAIFLFLSL